MGRYATPEIDELATRRRPREGCTLSTTLDECLLVSVANEERFRQPPDLQPRRVRRSSTICDRSTISAEAIRYCYSAEFAHFEEATMSKKRARKRKSPATLKKVRVLNVTTFLHSTYILGSQAL